MKKEMQDVLEKNILRFWLDKMIDRERWLLWSYRW